MRLGIFDDLPVVNQPQQPTQARLGLFDDIPVTQEVNTAAKGDRQSAQSIPAIPATIMRTAEGITLGTLDEITGGIGAAGRKLAGDERPFMDIATEETGRARETLRQADESAGLAGDVAEIGGSIGSALVAPGTGILRGGGLAAKVARGTGAGAAFGGVQGAGTAEGGVAERARGAGEGAALGAAVGALAAPSARLVGKAVENLRRSRVIKALPTVKNIKAKANVLFNNAKNSGVVVSQNAFQRFRADASEKLAEAGFDPELHPKLAVVFRRMERIAGDDPSIADIEKMRRLLKSPLSSIDRDEKRVAVLAKQSFDDFLETLSPEDVISGDPRAASQFLVQARQVWSQARKIETLEDVVDKARRKTARAGSGANLDNAIRQEFSKILDRPNLSRGFNADEKAAIRLVVEGTRKRNIARRIGKASPTGVVSGGTGTGAGALVGGAIGGPAGAIAGAAAVPAVGAVSKKLADRGTVKAAERVLQNVTNGGPLKVRSADQLEKLIRRLVIAQTGQLSPAGP